MDVKNLDLTKLNNLRIHELRDVARQLGVKSPTSQTKESIMQEINLIVTGQKDPYYNTRHQGRPSKADEINMANFESADEVKDKLMQPWSADTFNKAYILKCNEFEFTKTLPTDKFVEGIVDIHSEGYGLIRRFDYLPRPTDTFIPSSLVNKYKMVTGSKISGVERFVTEGKPYALINVHELELCDADYNSLVGGPLTHKIYSYLNTDVFNGGRYLIKNEKPQEIFLNAFDIAASVNKTNKDVVVKMIFIKSLPERLPQGLEGKDMLNLPFNTADKDLINAVNLYLAEAKLQALNKRVMVIMTGLTELAKAYNNILVGEYGAKLSIHTPEKINNILASAKSINNGNAGLTLVVLDNMKVGAQMQEMFEYEILDNFTNYNK